MHRALRTLARRLLGVRRTPAYYLPWITRPGLECALVLHNVEARFKPGWNEGPFELTAEQYGADGRLVARHRATVRDSTDAVELPLTAPPAGCGFVVVRGERVQSDLYVCLSDGRTSAMTHGRGEFVEHYPPWTRAVLAVLGGGAALAGRTLPAFARDQFVYSGAESRSHVLLLNLADVPNRIRVTVTREGAPLGARLLRLPPFGTHLLRLADLAAPPAHGTDVWRLRLQGNAWFNLYLVGAGREDLTGPLSLMHVK